MQSSSKPNRKTHPAWFRFLIIILLIGVFFRFFNLDKKIYWIDETYTALRFSGYTEAEMRPRFYDGRILNNEDMQKYKQINNEKNVFDTVKGLALEDPQHPPIYYVLVRYWVQWFGNSVSAIRSLSALLSLLVFPCLYWLCIELFNSPNVAWVAMAIVAISPFHVVYAQEAREYSLWTATILLSSAVLLWAMRTKTKIIWVTYAVTVALGLYTFIFTGLVAFGHGIYVIATERFKLTKTVKNYLTVSILGLLAFVPWILVVISNLKRIKDTTTWSNETTTALTLIVRWAGNLSRIFFDFGFDSSDSLSKTALLIPVILILLVLIGYSIYFLVRTTPLRVWLFVMTLVAVTPLILMIPDLILGGRRSGSARYLIASYLGIQITVAYLLATKITPISKQIKQRKWQLLMIVLVSCGILSCAVSSQAEEWWNKGTAQDPSIPKMVRIINQSDRPLLIVEDNMLSVLWSFSYRLKPNVGLQLVFLPNKIPKMPEKFSNVFLYKPSKALRNNLEKNNYVLTPIESLGTSKDRLLQIDIKK